MKQIVSLLIITLLIFASLLPFSFVVSARATYIQHSWAVVVCGDDYHASISGHLPDYLLLAFDHIGDGLADLGLGYYFTSDNLTLNPGSYLWGLQEGVGLFAMVQAGKSVLHSSKFTEDEGYVFNCTLPIKGGYFHGKNYGVIASQIKSDVIAVGFQDTEGYVYIPPFHFGVDVS